MWQSGGVMKTLILILLAGITTTFAQVGNTPKPLAPDPFAAKPNASVADDLLDARITAKKTQFATNQANLEKLKAELDAASSARPSNPAKLEELERELGSLVKSTEQLERELRGLDDERDALRNKTNANNPVVPVMPQAKPVEPPRAGRNKKPDHAAADPFVKSGTGTLTLTGESTYTGPAAKEVRPWNCQVLFETFDLSREDLLALLDEKGDDDARYRRVSEWMTAGRSKLTTFTALTTRLGQRSKVESIDEVRYPTEFDSPHSVDDIASPTTYEVKNAGETFETELSGYDDGQTVDANVAPSSVTLLKFADQLAEPAKPNSAISQPVFSGRSLLTSVALQLNHPRQIGTLSRASDGGGIPAEVRIAFLTVRRANLPQPKPEALVKEAPQTRLEYSFFSLDRGAARDLCLAKPEPQACYDGLRALVGEKKAQLEHLSTTVTRFGQQTQTGEILEVAYATEWDQGGAAKAPLTKPKDAPSTPDAKDGEAPKPQPNAAAIERAGFPTVATAFEIRNTGFSSQGEPQLGEDGTTVDLHLDLQFVRHAGPLEVTGVAKKYPPQPLFQTSKLNTSLKTTVGQQQLIGTFNAPAESGVNGRKDDGRVWLGFVRAVLVK